MIIDAHVHIFPEIGGLGAKRNMTILPIYDDTGRLVSIRRFDNRSLDLDHKKTQGEQIKHTPEMLIANMDFAGVAKAILLQGPIYGEHNQYVSEAVRRYHDRFFGAAYLDPWSPNCYNDFETMIGLSTFHAVKLEFTETNGLCAIHPNVRLDTLDITWLWSKLADRQLVLALDLGAVGSHSYQTGAVRKIAQEHPALKIVICHLAQPGPVVEADPVLMDMWHKQIELGELPNVWFDTASLPAYIQQYEDYPYPGVERYLRMAIEQIGPAKIIWGSDMPMTLAYATYSQYVEMARIHTRFLSASEQDMILSGNALQVYGII